MVGEGLAAQGSGKIFGEAVAVEKPLTPWR